MTEGSSAATDKTVIPVVRVDSALGTLAAAMVNGIHRDRRASLESVHAGMPAFLVNTIRVSEAAWKGVSRLALDVTDGQSPPATLATAIPPLARTFLDSLMAVVFIFGDTTNRLTWYYRAGWSEAHEEQGRLDKRFGTLPEWQALLSDHRDWIASHEKPYGITAAERLDPSLARAAWKGLNHSGYWPNPGKMRGIERKHASNGNGDQTRADFLEFLNDWFYGRLSGDSHLSYLGLARRGGILQEQHNGPNREAYRSRVVLTALSLYLALLSEVVVSASLTSVRPAARKAWELLAPYQEAEDLWKQRYDAALSTGGTP